MITCESGTLLQYAGVTSARLLDCYRPCHRQEEAHSKHANGRQHSERHAPALALLGKARSDRGVNLLVLLGAQLALFVSCWGTSTHAALCDAEPDHALEEAVLILVRGQTRQSNGRLIYS